MTFWRMKTIRMKSVWDGEVSFSILQSLSSFDEDFSFSLDICEKQDEARQWLDNEYEKDHRILDEESGQKEWEYQTNISDETAAASVSSRKYFKNLTPEKLSIC